MAPDDKKVVVSALMLACKPLQHEFSMNKNIKKSTYHKSMNYDIAKLLLCQAGMRDSFQQPAMMSVLDNYFYEMIEWLADVEGENINLLDNNTSLILAIQNGLYVWKYLVRYAGRRGQNGTTALIQAARQ